MKQKRIILLALLLLAVIAGIIFIVVNRQQPAVVAFFDLNVSKYAPMSIAYFDCKQEGLKDGSVCAKCESIYTDANANKKKYNIATDVDLIAYVKTQDKDCVNRNEGGN